MRGVGLLIAGPGPWPSRHVYIAGETPIQHPFVYEVPTVNRTTQLAGKLDVDLIRKCDAHATWESRNAALEGACSDPMLSGAGGPRQRLDAPRARQAFAAQYPKPPAPDADEWGRYCAAIKAVEQEYHTAAANTPAPPLDSRDWKVSWAFRGGQANATSVRLSAAVVREYVMNPNIEGRRMQLLDEAFQDGRGRWLSVDRFPELVAAHGPV